MTVAQYVVIVGSIWAAVLAAIAWQTWTTSNGEFRGRCWRCWRRPTTVLSGMRETPSGGTITRKMKACGRHADEAAASIDEFMGGAT